MILQALVERYEDLVKAGKIGLPGWSPLKVSNVLEISKEGELINVISIKTEEVVKNKTVLQPQKILLPEPVKRSSGVNPNFLCDNSTYLLGFDNKGKFENYSKPRFCACRDLHNTILNSIDCEAANALIAFFEKWDPSKAEENLGKFGKNEDILEGGNLIFRYDGKYIHEYDEIKDAWQIFHEEEDSEKITCIVSGKKDYPARLHPSFKGVRDAQSSGAALVSFNAKAFCSFDKEQGFNAPTGKYAAFAYGEALSELINDKKNNHYVGDTLVVSWASGGESGYQSAFNFAMFGDSEAFSENDFKEIINSICRGKSIMFDDVLLNPETDYYVLGIAPNAGRLSVRFFVKNSFEKVLKNVQEHYKRLEIVRPSYEESENLPVWKLIYETVNKNSRDKNPSPILSGEMLRSILNNSSYPVTLLNGLVLRIRAEREISSRRAAIIKAYYLKNKNKDVPEEVLSVSLNTETKNTAYVLGRLFSVLESIQERANPGINSTIKDKYFNSASATPSAIFPTLVNLSQKHLKKLDIGAKIHYEKKLGEIFELMEEEFPKRMNLPQQGAFQLGYYHQTQAKYKKNNVEEQ